MFVYAINDDDDDDDDESPVTQTRHIANHNLGKEIFSQEGRQITTFGS